MTIDRATATATLVDALESKWAGTKWSCKNELYSTLDWKDDNTVPKPTEEEINTEIARLQTEYDAQDYARKREAEYPDIYDYIDGIVKSDQAQIDKYIADCQAVKDKYSKGE